MIHKTINATSAIIGQYSDYVNFSDLSIAALRASCYCCGQEASWAGDHHSLCDACHFRHTVMKAAGREEEFWKAADASEYNQTVGSVAREMGYRMAKSIEALVGATAGK